LPPRIGVVTPAIPERLAMLAETIESVNAQTLAPVCHLIGIDHERIGCARNQTLLSFEAIERGCEWIALLADDDLFYPNHLEVLHAQSEFADVVYSWCDVEGRDWNPNSLYDPARLRTENYMPSTTLIRASLIHALKGWKADALHGHEDHDFWKRAQDVGARFVCDPTVTWKYRFHKTNASWKD
jgi:glycosyltransferase involved in cell wall biosynthesis